MGDAGRGAAGVVGAGVAVVDVCGRVRGACEGVTDPGRVRGARNNKAIGAAKVVRYGLDPEAALSLSASTSDPPISFRSSVLV
jgi:hypothetical protein